MSYHNRIDEDTLFDSLSGLSETSKEEPSETSKREPLETPKPEPKPEYFTVTSKTVTEGQSVYLKKQPSRGEIQGISRNNNPSSGPQAYDIYPVMTGVEDNGKRGIVQRTMLKTGDIKKCFNIPEQLPTGDYLSVTVTKPAIVQPTRDNQYLLEWKCRGTLKVTGGA